MPGTAPVHAALACKGVAPGIQDASAVASDGLASQAMAQPE